MKYRKGLFICSLAFCLLCFGCSDDVHKTYTQQAGSKMGALDEPAGAQGDQVISLKGGEGTGGNGGSGGSIDMDHYANVGMYAKTRNLDTGFTLPTPSYPENLGGNGVTISEDTVVAVAGAEPEAGVLYMVAGRSYLYVSNGNGVLEEADEVATGLKVEAGATLTLGLNKDYDSNGSSDCAWLSFDNDVVIKGTLATAGLLGTGDNRHGAPALARDKGRLGIESSYGRLTMTAGSAIDTAGGDAAAGSDERGGDGGHIYLFGKGGVHLAGTIDASGGDGDGAGVGGWGAIGSSGANSIGIYTDGSLINSGKIVASGGAGSIGGNAGGFDLDADGMLYNTGNIYATGGAGSTGAGGSVSNVTSYLYAGLSLFNSGNIYLSGGDGAAGGGNSYEICIDSGSDYAGNILNSGAVYANGGSCTGGTGNGGNGGRIYFEADGGDTVSAGEIQAMGGTGQGEGSVGGGGGNLRFYADYGCDSYWEEVASGLIRVTGNIRLDGGAGYFGGGGGNLQVDGDYDGDVFPPVQPVEFLGYAQIDLCGGNGAASGGSGGGIDIYTEEAYYGDGYDAFPTGAIVNRVGILARGGDGGTGSGGDGGCLEFDAEGEAYFGTTVVLNSGDIDVSGGSGNSGGTGGGADFYGHDYAENTGTIRSLGGDAEGDAAEGDVNAGQGASWGIYLLSAADVLNSGDVIATGGAATGAKGEVERVYGGSSGDFYMWAVNTATLSGSLYFNGGDSTDVGGLGGRVEIMSMKTPSVVSAGLISVAAGSGAAADDIGNILIDGLDVTPLNGTLP